MSLVAVCPPATKKESEENEVRLKYIVYQLSEFMLDQIVDMWTSQKELGTFHETYVYVRFPYYLACLVNGLSIGMSEASVGAHNFKSWICCEGRAVVPKAPPQIGQWEICIGGKKVPALTKEELARVQAKQEGSWESMFNARVQAQQQNIIRKEYYQQAYL